MTPLWSSTYCITYTHNNLHTSKCTRQPQLSYRSIRDDMSSHKNSTRAITLNALGLITDQQAQNSHTPKAMSAVYVCAGCLSTPPLNPPQHTQNREGSQGTEDCSLVNHYPVARDLWLEIDRPRHSLLTYVVYACNH